LKTTEDEMFDIQWKKFSEIQFATYLAVDQESLDRFYLWIETGDDEDAWA
jgi:hypothetical protein